MNMESLVKPLIKEWSRCWPATVRMHSRVAEKSPHKQIAPSHSFTDTSIPKSL